MPGVWQQNILEDKAASMGLRKVRVPSQGLGRYVISRHKAFDAALVSDDLVVCWSEEWSERVGAYAKFWNWKLSNIVGFIG